MNEASNEHQKIRERRQTAKRHRVIRFTLKDIADLRGVTVAAVQKAAYRGILDPSSLESIARYILRLKDTPQNAPID